MLQATKANVLVQYHKRSLNIRYKELEYFLEVFEMLTGISELLSGFAASAMCLEVETKRQNVGLAKELFLIAAGCAFGCNLLVILIASLCQLWGPGRALRGDGSEHLHDTVDFLEKMMRVSMMFFLAGLLSYFCSTFMIVWLQYDTLGCWIVVSMLAVFTILILFESMRVRRVFLSDRFANGRLLGNPVR